MADEGSLCLGFGSAQAYWRRVQRRRAHENDSRPLVRMLFEENPHVAWSQAPRLEPGLAVPKRVDPAALRAMEPGEKSLQLLVCEQQGRRALRGADLHLHEGCLPEGALARTDEGFLVARPPLTFVHMARILSEPDLISYGCELCGLYALSAEEDQGFVNVPALASVDELGSFLDRVCELRAERGRAPLWGIGRARNALAHVLERSASPAETTSALLLTLPARMGGYNLPRPELNWIVELDELARSIVGVDRYACDLCWPEERSVLEYQGKKTHKQLSRQLDDLRKGNVLDAMDFSVTQIAREQLVRRDETDVVARLLARRLGQELALDGSRFRTAQLRLRSALL